MWPGESEIDVELEEDGSLGLLSFKGLWLIDPTVTCTCDAVPFQLQLYSFLCDLYISIESDDTLYPCGRRNEEANMMGWYSKTCAIKWDHLSRAGIRETDIPQEGP